MKVAIGSDIHLDFSDLTSAFFGNKDNADVLLLAGDIVESRHASKAYKMFEKLSKEYPLIAFISGNHEFYGSNYQKSKDSMKKLSEEFPNVYYLDDYYMDLYDDYLLIGSTLWSNYLNGNPLSQLSASNRMNDFRMIRLESKNYGKLTPNDCSQWFDESKNYIDVITDAYSDKKVIVMSHHAPSFKSINMSRSDNIYDNGAYASELDEFIMSKENIKLWVHGHTHHVSDYYIGSCRVICNPRGYPNELGIDYYKEYKPTVVSI